MRQNLFHASPLVSGGSLAILGIPWLVEASLQLLPSSPCVHVSDQISAFYEGDTSHIGSGTHPTPVCPHLNLISYITTTLLPKKGHLLRYWELETQNMIFERILFNSEHWPYFPKQKLGPSFSIRFDIWDRIFEIRTVWEMWGLRERHF